MPAKPRFGFLRTGAVMGFLPDTPRNHTTAFMSELAGTFMFLFFAFSIAQVAHTPPPDDPNAAPNILVIFFIALGFGCSVAINVWLFYRVSGGMFNPAVRSMLSSSSDKAASDPQTLGHAYSLPHRRCACHTWVCRLHSPNAGRHCRGWRGIRHLTWPYGSECSARRRVFYHTRPLH